MTGGKGKLLEMLEIEQLEVDLFRGTGAGGETRTRIYGGHVIAQALSAANQSVPEERTCHSLHAYFISPGDTSIPVIYQVDQARDGGSFTTRRVVAIQRGRQILNLSASFQVAEESWDYQHQMPDVPGPEGLKNTAERRAAIADRIPEKKRADFLRPRPIEVREVDPKDSFEPEPDTDVNHMWFRMEEAAGQDQRIQQLLLAYASDITLLDSSLRPHGLTWHSREVMATSLDHAMWFHAPVKLEEWHLYTMDAPFTGGGRGFNRGLIFTQDGKLVANVAQEGLLRQWRER